MNVFRFRILMIDQYEELKCWREIEIIGNSNLYSLAAAVVTAFGFDFDHAFGFYSDLTPNCMKSAVKYELFADMDDADQFAETSETPRAGSVEKTAIAKAFTEPGQKMQFLFDYGDDWRFLIDFVGLEKKAKGMRYPLTRNEFGQAPEQYPACDDDDEWDDDEDDE